MAVSIGGRGADRRPAVVGGDDVQGGGGRSRAGRRQGGHYRGLQARQDTRPAARPRALRRHARGPLHHRRGRGDRGRGHGVRLRGDEARDRHPLDAARLRRSIARHRLRRLPRDQGLMPQEARHRRAEGDPGRSPGSGSRRLLSLREPGVGRRDADDLRHRPGARAQGGRRLRRHAGRVGRDLRRGVRRLRAVRARGDRQ